jgi:hypothetical protein
MKKQLIIPTGEGLITPADLGGNNRSGEIYLANEARFTSANFSQPLTAYSVGWKDSEDIKATLDFIAPEVPVGRRFEFKNATNSEEFLSETDDIRAIGSPFKRVEFKGTSTNEKTYNKGLTIRIDKDDMLDGDEERATMRLKTRLLRNDLRRAMTALLAIDNSGTAYTWNSSGTPDSNVMNRIDAAGDSSGINPNRIVYGFAAWLLRRTSYEAQATAGAFAGLNATVQEVAQRLGLSGGRVSSERYQSSATAKSKTIGAYFVVFNAADGVGKDDPTNLKRFVTPVGDMGLRVYREEHDKFIDISVEHYSNVVTTATVGAKKGNIS